MDRRDVFNENKTIFENSGYRWLGNKVQVGFGASKVYTPNELAEFEPPAGDGTGPRIEVVEGTTGDLGRQLKHRASDKVALLNFASAKNPGGGYKNGARAQEEDLCRCSSLYYALVDQSQYYVANRKCGTALYTDHIIYTPDVTFFREDGGYRLLGANEVATVDVITAPAPNAGAARETPVQVVDTLRRRAGYVLAVAAENGARNLVLGAWGCGVFRNDPETVADAFGTWLEDDRFRGAFDRVVFGIYAKGLQGEVNLNVFRMRFPGS